MEAKAKGMIFFMRHGERADQVEESELQKIEIAFDPHLTELGKLQARYAAYELEELAKQEFPKDVKYLIVSSPFLRCIETAVQVMLALGTDNVIDKQIHLDDFLSEFLHTMYFKTSPMEGLHSVTKLEALQELIGTKLQRGLLNGGKHLAEIKYPEESFEILYSRITKGYQNAINFYKNVIEKEGNVVLILVTHGYGVQSFLDYYNAFDFEKGVEYTSLSQVLYDFETGLGEVGKVQIHDQLEKAKNEYERIKKEREELAKKADL